MAKDETAAEEKPAAAEKKEVKKPAAKTEKKDVKKDAKKDSKKDVKKAEPKKEEAEDIPMDAAAIKAYSSVIADAAEDSEPSTPVEYH
jgi:hypothetical protein